MSLGISEPRPRPSTAQIAAVARIQRLPTLIGLVVCGFAALAALEGQLQAGLTHPEDARPWLILAALLGATGVWFLERDVADHGQAEAETWYARHSLTSRHRFGGFALLIGSGIGSAIAVGLVVVRGSEAMATSIWFLALMGAGVGAAILSRRPRFGKPPRLELALLLIVLAVAAWLRIPDLATTPTNLHGDEASIGLEARRILAGDLPAVFATGWYDVPALSFALHAATMRIFGDNLFGLRMASAFEGLSSIVLLYLLARRLWGARPALLAAALMAVSAWHIHFSRTGFHYMQATAAALFTLYFTVRATQDRRALDWLLCGFGIGLCIEVYYAARLVPLIVAVYLGFRALQERRFLRTHATGLAALAFGAVIFVAPLIVVFARSPQSFGARTGGVLVTTPSNLEHELDAYRVHGFQDVLAIQALHTLEAFNIRGETSLQYGHPTPLLDVWTGSLLAISVLAILLRPGSSRGVLLASWTWLTLIVGSVLTVDALFSPRVLLALPALVLGPALLLDRAWLAVTNLRGRVATYVFAVPVVVVLALALQANAHDYFDIQVVDRQPPNRFTRLALHALPIADRYRLYAIGRGDWSFASEAPRFLVPQADTVNVRDTPLALPLEHVPSSKGAAFLVETGAPDYTQRMDAIRLAYPRGHEELVTDHSGHPAFTSYLVDSADLLAANPGARRD